MRVGSAAIGGEPRDRARRTARYRALDCLPLGERVASPSYAVGLRATAQAALMNSAHEVRLRAAGASLVRALSAATCACVLVAALALAARAQSNAAAPSSQHELAFTPAQLRAAPPAQRDATVRLTWSAPEQCPDQRAAQRTLMALLGGSERVARAVAIEVSMTRVGDEYVARIVFSGATTGGRSLAGKRCDELADAVALIVALTVDPLRASSELGARRYSGTRGSAPVNVELGVHAALDVGSLPRFSFGAGLHLGLSLQRFRAALEGAYWLPRSKLLSSQAVDAAEFGLWEAGVRTCVEALRVQSWGLAPCAAVSVGGSSGARDERLMLHKHTPWVAARLGAALRQYSDPLFVELAGDLGIAIVRPSYAIDDQEFFSPGPLFGRVRLSLGWRL